MEYPPASAEPTSTGIEQAPAPALVPALSTASRRRVVAQKVLAFAMTALVGMNDSATGANVSCT